MREFLKRAKADYLLSSVLCIVLGIIFVVWKGGVIDVIGTLLSVAMIIVGIIYLGSFILSLATFGASTIVGILVLAVGIWFLIQPSLIVSLVPVILGVGLVFHGIRAVTDMKSGAWILYLLSSVWSVVWSVFSVRLPY